LTQLGVAAAVLGAVLCMAPPAAAQDDVTLTMARERFKEGVTYFDKKDFAKARVAFLQAYALKKHPAVLLNLAQSELRSGHEADAAQHFSQYLREHKDASEAERQGAETGLTAAKALVAEVALEVDASGAEVYVDGDAVGSTPLAGPLFLAPGSHRIQVRKEGKTTNSDVAVAAGQSTKFSVKLAAPVAAAPPATSTDTTAPAEEVTSAPPENEPPAAQESARRTPFGRWVGKTPGALVGIGVTGVGLIGGGVFAFASKAAYDAADSVAAGIGRQALEDGKKDDTGACVRPEEWLAEPPSKFAGPSQAARREVRAAQYQQNCDKFQSNVKSGDTYKAVAIVGFAVAGAAAVGTIIYYVVDSKEDAGQARGASKRRVTVLPVYQPGYSGALISGTF
jgi:hypothetical protein